MIDKERRDKDFSWNPSNCECQCDKLRDIGEYLEYKNCKCKKRLIDKLVEECSENIDGNEIIYDSTLSAIPLSDYRKTCNSCTVYIVLLAILFIISLSVSNVFCLLSLVFKKKIY